VSWLPFWRTYVTIYLVASIFVIIWFSAGGLIDLKEMIRTLKVMKRDHTDSGFVMRDKT
jgi:hypothetical protein